MNIVEVVVGVVVYTRRDGCGCFRRCDDRVFVLERGGYFVTFDYTDYFFSLAGGFRE